MEVTDNDYIQKGNMNNTTEELESRELVDAKDSVKYEDLLEE